MEEDNLRALPKIDRSFHIVLREGAEAGEETRERFVSGRPGLLGAVLVFASMMAWQWIGPWAAIGLGVGITMMRASILHKPRKLKTVTRKARVEISASGIKAVGERFIPRADIAQAYFQPRGGQRPTVRCLDRRHVILFEAEVDDEDEAQEILAALGHDASQVRSEFRVAGPYLETSMGWMLSGLACAALSVLGLWAGGRGGWPYALPILATAIGMMGVVGTARRVEVGIDGVLVQWMTRRRFIPFEEIVDIETAPRRVELVLRDDTHVRLVVPSAKLPDRIAALDVAALAARIEEARRAHARSASARELASAVARGERGVAEWRAELERLHDPETRGGYRTLAARGEDLWRVVEDTTAPEDARAGAAMALRKEDGAHPRLRVAAEAVASPKLRVALERAADPESDEAALDEALEAFTPPRRA